MLTIKEAALLAAFCVPVLFFLLGVCYAGLCFVAAIAA